MWIFMMILRLLNCLAKEETKSSLIEKYAKRNGMTLVKLRVSSVEPSELLGLYELKK